jgi:site-specific DNA-methyltransferase (adenine-specific)
MIQLPNNYLTFQFGNAIGLHGDCLEVLGRLPSNSIHAVVTDPPYGVKEYDFDQLEKRSNGNGGIMLVIS